MICKVETELNALYFLWFSWFSGSIEKSDERGYLRPRVVQGRGYSGADMRCNHSSSPGFARLRHASFRLAEDRRQWSTIDLRPARRLLRQSHWRISEIPSVAPSAAPVHQWTTTAADEALPQWHRTRMDRGQEWRAPNCHPPNISSS